MEGDKKKKRVKVNYKRKSLLKISHKGKLNRDGHDLFTSNRCRIFRKHTHTYQEGYLLSYTAHTHTHIKMVIYSATLPTHNLIPKDEHHLQRVIDKNRPSKLWNIDPNSSDGGQKLKREIEIKPRSKDY